MESANALFYKVFFYKNIYIDFISTQTSQPESSLVYVTYSLSSQFLIFLHWYIAVSSLWSLKYSIEPSRHWSTDLHRSIKMFFLFPSLLSLITFHVPFSLLMWEDYISGSFLCAAADTERRVRNGIKHIAPGRSALSTLLFEMSHQEVCSVIEQILFCNLTPTFLIPVSIFPLLILAISLISTKFFP